MELFILCIKVFFGRIFDVSLGTIRIVNILHLFPPNTSVYIWSPTTAICSFGKLSFSLES